MTNGLINKENDKNAVCSMNNLHFEHKANIEHQLVKSPLCWLTVLEVKISTN